MHTDQGHNKARRRRKPSGRRIGVKLKGLLGPVVTVCQSDNEARASLVTVGRVSVVEEAAKRGVKSRPLVGGYPPAA
jgi:hypothetical protein